MPRPPEAKLYLPGLALMTAISSRASVAGTEGFTTKTKWETPNSVTGAKSLMGSYGTLA